MKQSRHDARLKAAFLLTAALALSCGTLGGRHTPAEAFLRDFNTDRLAAYEKYADEDIYLTGTAFSPKEHEDGKISLGLVAGARLTENIICDFEGSSPQVRDALLKIKDGEQVKVKCRLGPLSMKPAVSLESCQLQ